MNFLNINIQIRPCIVSNAKFALGLKNIMPLQNVSQRCTQDYWIRTIDTICNLYRINNRITRQNAIDRFDELTNNFDNIANRRFYLEYTVNNRLERITIRNWANGNRRYFPEYTFEDRKSHFPITQVISKFLQTRFGFEEIEENGEVILRNPNVNFRF